MTEKEEVEVRELIWDVLTILGEDLSGLDGPQHHVVSTIGMANWVQQAVEESLNES